MTLNFDVREFGKLYRSLDDEEKKVFITSLTAEEAYLFANTWEIQAREKQLAPEGNWRYWMLMCGRGWGKSLVLVKWAHQKAMNQPGSFGALVARVASEIRSVLIRGPSGILNVVPEYERPHYNSSKSLLTWKNGSSAELRSADKPDSLRGLNTHWAVCDEYASWRYPDSLDQLILTNRLGEHPQIVLATTPKPVTHLREFLQRENLVLTTGSSYENRDNLSPDWFAESIVPYEGTRLGRQEILGELLEDQFGSLWKSELIDPFRVEETPELERIVVAVDPAVSNKRDSNSTGIIVAGKDRFNHCYVLDDLTLKSSPEGWGLAAIEGYRQYRADRIVGERNNGGDLVERNIHVIDPNVPFSDVTATRGKTKRAEPIVGVYEQGRVHHVGVFAELESQMLKWTSNSKESPDHLDALVWALWELLFSEKAEAPVMRQAVARYKHGIRW